MRFQVDPGSNISCIGQGLAEKLNIVKTQASEPLKLQVATGTTVETVGERLITCTLERLSGIKFRTKLYILPGNLDVILLGEPFLIAEEVQLDYREGTLRIADRVIFLDSVVQEFSESPDSTLISKALTVQIKSSLNSAERNLLERCANQTPVLGTFRNYKMSIKLSDHRIIKKQPFTVPFKAQEALKEEIKRGQELGIIVESNSPYACPAFPIIKENGNIRLVID